MTFGNKNINTKQKPHLAFIQFICVPCGPAPHGYSDYRLHTCQEKEVKNSGGGGKSLLLTFDGNIYKNINQHFSTSVAFEKTEILPKNQPKYPDRIR